MFSPAYATSLGAPPQDVAVCSNMEGGSSGWASPPPVTGTFGANDYATWNANGGQIVSGTGLTLGAFPTTNFSGFPVLYEAPFATAYEHFLASHLQTLWPGNGGIQAESFTLDHITVTGGVATAACTGGDCSLYCSTGQMLQVTGSALAALDGKWQEASATCAANTVQLAVPGIADGMYSGGQVWAPDYLPTTLPFALAHGATTFELHECTLDYAYGVQTVGTAAHACAGMPGPDPSYQALLAGIMQ